MNRTTAISIVSILLVVIVALLLWITRFLFAPNELPSAPQAERPAIMSTLELTSSAFSNGGLIPAKYTCTGENMSPPLSISGVPDKTASFALIVDDPDAPVGVWDHWIVFNMDKSTHDIPEGKEPQGTPGKGSSGQTGYMGPCPPSGVHRYMFALYALDSTLDIPASSTKAEVIQAMNGHVLAETVLVGRFGKNQ